MIGIEFNGIANRVDETDFRDAGGVDIEIEALIVARGGVSKRTTVSGGDLKNFHDTRLVDGPLSGIVGGGGPADMIEGVGGREVLDDDHGTVALDAENRVEGREINGSLRGAEQSQQKHELGQGPDGRIIV